MWSHCLCLWRLFLFIYILTSYQFYHFVLDDVRKQNTSASFRNPFLYVYRVIFVWLRRRGWGDVVVWVYCLSCADQIISVFRIYVLVIAPPPRPTHPRCLSLSNTHPRGQLSVRVILHILCGKGQRGALALTRSLPREKVWCGKMQTKITVCLFFIIAARSVPWAR